MTTAASTFAIVGERERLQMGRRRRRRMHGGLAVSGDGVSV
jgi:hypothetical protein